MQAELGDAFGKCLFDDRGDGDAADILPKVLTALANWSVAPQRVRLLRIIIAERVRFPEIVTIYDSAFDRRIIKPLQALIDIWIDRGQIDVHDSDHSARQLAAMIMGQVQQRAMLTGYRFTKEELAACGQAASHLFLCRHTVIDNKVL
nr:TetR/AcrR family transcriptional regulator C-terminal domain-containing protein [Paracoccus sp. 228]